MISARRAGELVTASPRNESLVDETPESWYAATLAVAPVDFSSLLSFLDTFSKEDGSDGSALRGWVLARLADHLGEPSGWTIEEVTNKPFDEDRGPRDVGPAPKKQAPRKPSPKKQAPKKPAPNPKKPAPKKR